MTLKAPLKRLLVTIGVMVAIFVPAILLHSPTFAQSADAANGLQISPALVQLNGEAGKSYNVELKVLNVTGSDLSFKTAVNDFAAKDETGTPSILLDEAAPTPTSIQTWVTSIPDFSLKAHETKTIIAVITIPVSAEPGGHYGVIRFSGTSPTLNGTGVGLSASAGTLFLVRVAGTVTEKLTLATFEATANSKQSALFEYGPITFVTRFQNTGNVHVQPTGTILIENIFKNKVASLDINSEKGNILPSSTRRFESTLNQKWLFGRYTATTTVGYGTQGQAIVETISFWVIPYKLILVGLAVLATLIYILRKAIKRYNKYIIAQSRKKK
ncbi:MAG: exported protein of unknown function [Candidatus Saccharibacteria bacterium]|nr:exported protein of unknown function [Candidatus Saccharibacteria bacterium]